MYVDRMRANSLALRLFLSATAWAVVILLITGIVLSSLYRQAVERAFNLLEGAFRQCTLILVFDTYGHGK